MKRFLIYLLTVVFLQLQAQKLPRLRQFADTLQIRIGEQIKLRVEAVTDTLSFVDFPKVSELGDMEVVGSSVVDTLQAKPFRQLLKEYYLTQWDSGDYLITPLQIHVNDSIVPLDSLRVKVLPVAVDTTKQDLYDFKSPILIDGKETANSSTEISLWWWLLLFPLLILIYYLYKRRQLRIDARKEALTPYEKVEKDLQELLEKKLWLKDRVDEHYFQLTNLLKEYLEKELHLSAKEKISSEILLDLQKYRFEDARYFPTEMIKRLKETFKRADLAKFAKLLPISTDIDLDFNNIKSLITYAHSIVQEIADVKAAELVEKEYAKRRKKRIAWTITGVIVLLLAFLGGGIYYWFNKNNLTKNLKENIAAPEWVYNEYGASPALGVTTPHILHWYDLQSVLDTVPQVKKIMDEASVYIDQNPVKRYMILVASIDLKTELSAEQPILEGILQEVLKQFHAKNVNMQQADIEDGKRFFGDFLVDIPSIGDNVKVEFDSHFYRHKNGLKYLIGMYLKGDKRNKELIERVLNSAELVD